MLTGLVQEYAAVLLSFLLGTAGCTLAELVMPAERQSWASRARGILFGGLSLAGAVLANGFTQSAMQAAGWSPLLRVDLSQTIHSDSLLVVAAGYTLVPLAALFVYDLGYYVFHRLQHTVPILWRYHAVHHSIEELNVFNAYHHVSEYFWRIPLLTIPVNLLFWIGEPQVAVTGLLIGLVGKLGHANTRLGFGPLRYLATEPAYHRIHHSLEERHWNRNFAFYFPLLDVMFRTAHFPAKDEFPATGLDYMREPRSLRAFLLPPAPPPLTASATTPPPAPDPVPAVLPHRVPDRSASGA